MGGLLNTWKFVHKMSADTIKFGCSSGEPVQVMQNFVSFVQVGAGNAVLFWWRYDIT